MKHFYWGALLLWCTVLPLRGQDVVVNEYLNASSANEENVELLVLKDKMKLGGYVVRDFGSGANIGGIITFSTTAALWANVRSGYIIVIEFGEATSADTSWSDGVVVVGEKDTDLFIDGPRSLNIAGTDDGVQVLDANGNHVHILYHGTPEDDSDFEAATLVAPSAHAGSAPDSDQLVRFKDTSALADFADDAKVEVSSTLTQGLPNDAVQQAFKAKLLPIWINEINADQNAPAGPPEGQEYVEIVGPNGFALTGYQVEVYECTGGTATGPIVESIGSYIFSTYPGTDQWGFFVIAGVSLFNQNVNQTFAGAGTDVLSDESGIVVLKDPDGHEVFAYQYDIDVPGGPQCPTGRTTRSPADLVGNFAMGFAGEQKPSDAALGSNTMTATVGAPNEGQELPVELVAFEAVADGEAVLLRWETASETNNAGFEILGISKNVGADGRPPQWEVYGFVEGHGTTSEARHYVYHVVDLVPGVHGFRLKQIDYDGTFEYCPEVEVAVGVPGVYHLSDAYPNPFNPQTQFSLSVSREQHVRVEVYNVLGRRVALLHDGRLPAGGARTFRFDGASVAGGVYVIRVAGEQFATSRLVTLLK